MQFDNIRVSRKLWGMFLVLMVIMLVISGFQQYRATSSLAQAIEEVISIEGRVTEAVRWRGSTETAVNMEMAMPRPMVTANPRTGPEPNQNSKIVAISAVTLLSTMVE